MDGWILSTCVWNVASYMVSVVVYGLIYLSFSKISFRWVSIIIDVFSIVYFRFRNYHNTDAVFLPIIWYVFVSDEKM
jgi:hypothetical protein